MNRTLLAVGACLVLAGCGGLPSIPMPSMPKFGIPKIHKITVYQGNVLTQRMVDDLRPGMTRRQVVFVLGEPVNVNPFRLNRWDYIYTVTTGEDFYINRRVSVYFEDDALVRIEGDLAPGQGKS
ncbi:MAG: outer membrane protein assembly factor BamE [Gammaproteobacteria bacterium]|nr:outer membrane protein assembly factor BamE [Gammaproteobacteria bacterium]